MNYEIIELSESRFSYFETDITTSHKINSSIISEHWKKFNSLLRVNHVNLGSNWEKFGITVKSNGKYKYQCAYQTNSSIAPFHTSIIPSGKCAKFNHVGPINLISKTINYIYKIAIPEFPLCVDADRSILHIEKYDSRFDWNSNKSIIEIYLPLNGDFNDINCLYSASG